MTDPNDDVEADDTPPAGNPVVDQQAALQQAVEEGDPDGSAASGA